MKLLLVILIFFFSIFNLFSCDLADDNWDNRINQETFYKVFGGNKEDYGFSVDTTNDGGYILAGFSTSYGNGNWDAWIVKTDKNGNGLWNRSYGTPKRESAWQIMQTNNSGYIILGEHSPDNQKGNILLIQTDSLGYILNETSYGGEENDGARQIIKTSDGGFAIIGYTYSFTAGGRDIWLIKTDSNGNKEWSESYGWVYNETGYSLIETIDNGFFLVGSQWNPKVKKHNIYIVKVDSKGNFEWDKKIHENNTGFAHKIINTSDGLYAISGISKKLGNDWYDLWMAKIDFSGNFFWQQIYSTSHIALNQFYFVDIKPTNDGGFISVGPSDQFGKNMDALLMKFDSDGNNDWYKTYGGKNQEIGLSVVQARDGGYAFIGRSNSYGNGLYDYFFVKTDSIGQSVVFTQ